MGALTELLHPENGSGVVFHFDGHYSVAGRHWSGDVVYSGAQTRTLTLEAAGDVRALGVRFLPGGASAFWRDAVELKNQHAPLSEVGAKGAGSLHEQLAELTSAAEMVEVVERWLLQHLSQNLALPPSVAEALRLLIHTQGQEGIESVASQLSISRRSLERQFRDALGVTPKECASIYRVKEARRLLMGATDSGTEIAHLLGYTDQAHFIRQFRQVVGLTPSQYRQRRR